MPCFMKLDDAEKSFLMLIFPLGMFVVCLIGSQIIMPEHCDLFATRPNGQSCHTIPETYPCPICKDIMTATLARVLFAMGILFLLLPFAVGMIQSRRGSIEKINLFE